MNSSRTPLTIRPASRDPGCRRAAGSALLLATALIALGAVAPAQSIVGAKVSGKDRNAYAVWFSSLSFTIRTTTAGITRPPAPAFTIDLYDEDGLAGDEGRDVDLTQGSSTVQCSTWRFRGPAGSGRSSWDCSVRTGGVQEMDVTDPAPFDWPDPRIEIVVTVGTAPRCSVTLCAPGLPSVGAADFGIESPSAIANSRQLAGERIAALSRGFDDISLLPFPMFSPPQYRAALYFACEHNSPVPASDPASGPGRVFVLDAEGDLWPEDLYAANYDPNQAMLGTPRYLNLNTAAAGSQTPTSEIYFVYEGTDEILYSPSGDPTAASVYLDLATPLPVTALAVEDSAPRGVWGHGDFILYAIENSAAIFALTYGLYGNTPVYFVSPRAVFDGSTSIGFEHFDRNNTAPSSLRVGDICALAVSYPGRDDPEPADRVVPGVVDYNWLTTYGPTDGGWVGFRNYPVLGEQDFRVTLRRAGPRTIATLMGGAPVSLPGIPLPRSISTSVLLLDPTSTFPVGSATSTVGGAAERVLAIPNEPSLAGARFGFQWIVWMPATLPLSLSDVGVARLR